MCPGARTRVRGGGSGNVQWCFVRGACALPLQARLQARPPAPARKLTCCMCAGEQLPASTSQLPGLKARWWRWRWAQPAHPTPNTQPSYPPCQTNQNHIQRTVLASASSCSCSASSSLNAGCRYARRTSAASSGVNACAGTACGWWRVARVRGMGGCWWKRAFGEGRGVVGGGPGCAVNLRLRGAAGAGATLRPQSPGRPPCRRARRAPPPRAGW